MEFYIFNSEVGEKRLAILSTPPFLQGTPEIPESTPVHPETPINGSFLYKNRIVQKEFPTCHINTDNYFREVRRALLTHMFSFEPICIGKYNAFCRRYEREGGKFNRENSQPKFDAWALVRGTSRLVFNYHSFF